MELIQPAEISGKIMTIIDQAKEYIIIVSPYNKISNWDKLLKRLDQAKQNGIKIEWFIRKGVEGNDNEIRRLGIIPIEVENLHSKIYLNERNAIVTSMNLHFYSDNNSIDIGYEIKEKDKHFEILEFIDNYIRRKIINSKIGFESTENVTQSKNGFTTILSKYLETNYSSIYSEQRQFTSRYFDGITLEKFKENYKLVFEPKETYYRLDLRIEFPYNLKVEKYNQLKEKATYISNAIGVPVNFGHQMKRLKIDIEIPGFREFRKWNESEFLKLKPIFDKAIDFFNTELN